MSLQDLETKTSDFINTNYPSQLWIRVYTDGSADEAVRNGDGGVLIDWLDGTKVENSIPPGRHSTNYKAEAVVAIEEAVALLRTSTSYNKTSSFSLMPSQSSKPYITPGIENTAI